jgi:hypothetical protein
MQGKGAEHERTFGHYGATVAVTEHVRRRHGGATDNNNSIISAPSSGAHCPCPPGCRLIPASFANGKGVVLNSHQTTLGGCNDGND